MQILAIFCEKKYSYVDIKFMSAVWIRARRSGLFFRSHVFHVRQTLLLLLLPLLTVKPKWKKTTNASFPSRPSLSEVVCLFFFTEVRAALVAFSLSSSDCRESRALFFADIHHVLCSTFPLRRLLHCVQIPSITYTSFYFSVWSDH